TMFGQPCDLSIYSSAFIGGMAALVDKTDVDGILKINLNATDSFGDNEYRSYLFYNPFSEDRIIVFESGREQVNIFDSVTNGLVASNVTGKVNLRVPAQSAKVIRILPNNDVPVVSGDGNSLLINDRILSRYQASVNFVDLSTRAELTSSSIIAFETFSPVNDEVVNMKILFGDILVYDGEPLSDFSYQKSMLPDTDYTLKVEITTRQGLSDYATKRVVCR
ncbi:MAG: hypothetical protein RBR44_03780, partial [Bacilli bacterium]|nr:hypothetical protein [Bacilli bacterium]